jgi:hypothetical protein
MIQPGRIPDWLGAALVAAAVAFVGFVGKTTLDSLSAARETERTRRAQLVALHSLLWDFQRGSTRR